MEVARRGGDDQEDDDERRKQQRNIRDNPHYGDKIDVPLIELDEEGLPTGAGLLWLRNSWEKGGGLFYEKSLKSAIRKKGKDKDGKYTKGMEHVVNLAVSQRRQRATINPTGRAYQRLAFAQNPTLVDNDMLIQLAEQVFFNFTPEQREEIMNRRSRQIRDNSAKRQRK
tara:strand:- start:262 stop:768 length:507 start_codon:yes stop_codon:yes gene_type:complete